MVRRTRDAIGIRVVVLIGLLLVPVSAWAQGIAGTVRDASGGVLPGVTVEASSPALIERVRTAITDNDGRYNIIELRPGAYTVTFTLGGFGTFRREGVSLTAGFTATVNAVLQVGTVEETITVAGGAPLVDTQNVRQQTVISEELIAALPSGSKGHLEIIRLIPGMNSDRIQGAGGAGAVYAANATHGITLHGKGGARTNYDGMQINNLSATGNIGYIANPATAVETAVETGGFSAESNSGLSFNFVPKEGGNTFRATVDGIFTNWHLQGDNVNDAAKARGVPKLGRILRSYDANFTLGGPVKRDRIWFFAATRFTEAKNETPGAYFNKTQGTPFYTPDLDRPALAHDWLKGQAGRITWQASEKNKVNVFADVQSYQVRGQQGNIAPEADTCWVMWPMGIYQASWNSPVSSKFLLEAGVGLTEAPWPCQRDSRKLAPSKITDVSILEQSTGIRYNAPANYAVIQDTSRYVERFSASYVTGSHTFKAGVQLQQHVAETATEVNRDVNYRFNRGVPNQITQFATPYSQLSKTDAELGIYAQDSWTINRMSLVYGLRFDYMNGTVPEQSVPAGQFIGARNYGSISDVPNWKDLSPRVGVSFDVFGDGRTALKGSLGRYVGKHSVDISLLVNPIATSINSASRVWVDANNNFIPDCDLRIFTSNGECRDLDNVNFGNINPNSIQYSDALTRGWHNRDYTWDVGAELQHELRAGVSILGGYYRNWSDHYADNLTSSGNSFVTDNLAWEPSDFDDFCVTAPLDSRLPNGGGYEICGLYNISVEKFSQSRLFRTRASDYGDGKSRVSDFFTVSLKARLGQGRDLGMSVDTGRTVEDRCFVIDSPQELKDCRVVRPFSNQTQFKAHLTQPLPRGFSVSGVLQNFSGLAYDANFAFPNSQVAPSLGRNLSSCGTAAVCTATVTVPLVAPFTLSEPRRTVIDVRMSKNFSVAAGRTLRANVDVYNLLNSVAFLGVNSTYGPNWTYGAGRSGGVMPGRVIQFGGQFTF